jgi:hypothetical protein
MGWDEREVRGVAAGQHALIDRATLLHFGATDSIIAQRLRAGTLGHVYPGVYDYNVTRREWVGAVQAAVLAAGPQALASHRTAGVLWGLDGVSGRMLELTVPFTKEPVPEGVLVHRTRRRLPRETVDSVPITNVERTLLDLAALLPPIVLEKAMTSAIYQHLTTIDMVVVRLSQEGGRGVKGTRKLRKTLALLDGGITGSPSEVDLMSIMRTAPIPFPECQFEIAFPEGDHAYPDFAWPDRRKCVEVDGFSAHGSPEALERDLSRQNRLLEMGWELRRFSARTVRRDPDGVLAEIIRFIND